MVSLRIHFEEYKEEFTRLWLKPKLNPPNHLPKCDCVDISCYVRFNKGAVLSHKKGGDLTFCNSMDEHGEYYAKWNKPVREGQVSYDFTYMWNLFNKTN